MDNVVEFKIKLTDINTKIVRELSGEFENVNEVLSTLRNRVKDAGDGIDKAASQSFKWGQLREAIQGVSDLLREAISPAEGFELGMRKANTMANKGAQEFAAYKGQISELSKAVPIARDALAQGFYQVISNSVPEDNWIDFLTKSSRTAVGGIADLEKVVIVTSTVIKNYGLAWSAAGEIQDKIQLTAKNGVTNFEQLSEALPRVTGSAASLGVSINELLGTFATLTGVSGSTAEVSTQLKAIFTALIKPSSEAAEMAKKMGIEFDAAAIKGSGGLLPFLQKLNTQVLSFSQSSGILQQEVYGALFGSAEALSALIPLTGELATKFDQNVKVMANSAGTIDNAFAEMNGTNQAFEQRMKNTIASLSDFAYGIIGPITPLIQFVAQVGMAVFAINQLRGIFGAFKITSFISGLTSSTTSLLTNRAAMTTNTVSTGLYRTALNSLTVSLGSARIAAVALSAAMTLGLTIAITAAVELWQRYSGAVNDGNQANTRMSTAIKGMQSDITKESTLLTGLFTSLNKATVGSDEWKRAKDRITAQYGAYLSNLGIEITSVGSAELAYRKLSSAILAAARSRASSNAITAASDSLASKEADMMAGLQKVLTEKYGETTGNRVFNGIAASIRRGESEIPARWKQFIDKTQKSMVVGGGNVAGDTDIINSPIQVYVNQLQKSRKDYEIEVKQIEKTFGAPIELTSKAEVNGLTEQTKATEQLLSLEQIGTKITALKGEQSKALTVEEGKNIQKQIAYYENLLKARQRAYGIEVKDGNSKKKTLTPIQIGESELNKQIKSALGQGIDTTNIPPVVIPAKVDMSEIEDSLTGESYLDVNFQIRLAGMEAAQREVDQLKDFMKVATNPDEIQTLQDRINTVYKAWPKLKPQGEWISDTQVNLEALSGAMSNLGSSISGTAGQWLNWGANVLQAIAQAIPAIIALSSAQAMQAFIAQKLAISQAAASVAATPFIGPVLAIAAIASMVAAFASLPAFADGGIAYGPTLGLFGEYSGAQNNPEVVAPLNKLRSLISPSGSGLGGEVKFEIEGTKLMGVLNKVNSRNKRNG